MAAYRITELHVAVGHAPVAGIVNRSSGQFVRWDLPVGLVAVMDGPGLGDGER